jgi:threonine dehydratase
MSRGVRADLPVPIPLDQIRAARERLAGSAVRTPIVPLTDEEPLVFAKLESLQPIGSFKMRGAGNAVALATAEALAGGVYTASAGNMAQGVAWNARRLGIACTAIVPNGAPRAKLDAIERLGARVMPVTMERWWQVLLEHGDPGMDGLFIHPFADQAVIAGNGTIGLEIAEDLPSVAAVVVPYGGGGLSTGIASAIKAVLPAVRVYAAEVEGAAPFAASLEAGRPVTVEARRTWVDGIGGGSLLPEMWPLASRLLDSSIVVTLDQIAESVRLVASRGRVVAEGAGAAAVAAALTARAGEGPVVAVVSGGNLDASLLATILARGSPMPGA